MWKYLDNGTNQGTAWRNVSFNDSNWAEGNAQLGYGDGDEATVISFGPSSTNKYITTYFRKHFVIDDINKYSKFDIQLLRDDGAVVYINGTQVIKDNLAPGQLNYLTKAKTDQGPSTENTYHLFGNINAPLVTGNNVIAVELHQINKLTDDAGFDLTLTATSVSTPCSKPQNISVTNITNSSAHLSWSAVSSATSYEIEYKTIDGSGVTINAVTNSLTLTGLATGKTYKWKVKSNCTGSGSSFSSSLSFTTQQNSVVDTLIGENAV